MDHEQAGSAKGKSCLNNLHIILNINKKIWKKIKNKDKIWAFLDISNAFGSTKQEELINIMKERIKTRLTNTAYRNE
jgi:hypothetical protein